MGTNAFGYVIPDECHDQHGDPPYCVDSGSLGDRQDQQLVATGDRYLGALVATITGAPFWAHGNNAVVVTYDEGEEAGGCCGGTASGGKVATVVVTSHGPRGLADPTPYNHYSLLQTLQRTFGLGCLAASCDTTHIRPLSRLLAPTGAPAIATRPLPVPRYDTATPALREPVSHVSDTPSAAGWTVQRAPRLGRADNSFGAVSAAAPDDVWAVGNYLPDAVGSNPDATRTLAAHFTGSRWTYTPTPSPGPNFGTLFGVAARPGRAWAVGVALDRRYQARSVIEAWDGARWRLAAAPHLPGRRDLLFAAAAVSDTDVWAVGERQDAAGRFAALAEHWDGRRWSVVPAVNPGSSGNHFYGVAALARDDVWAVGQRNGAGGDVPLVEHWNGRRWMALAAPAPAGAAAVLQGVAVDGGQVWAVGQTDDAAHGGRPVVERYSRGRWTSTLLAAGSRFTNLTGVTVSGHTPWAVGTYFDPATGIQRTLIVHRDRSGWRNIGAPSPGSGDSVLGGITSAGANLWAVGYDKDATGRQPLIEHHRTATASVP